MHSTVPPLLPQGSKKKKKNSCICTGQGDLSNPLLAGRDQLLEGQNVFKIIFKQQRKTILTKMLTRSIMNYWWSTVTAVSKLPAGI